MNLYLFDVDHTLLDVDIIHEEAYKNMYREFFSLDHSLSLPRGQERTTYNIIRCALSGKMPGSKIEEQMKDAVESMVRLYFSRVNPLFVHSNVGNVIDKLRQSHMVGVFTGGARNITNAILKKAKLYEKFHHISTCDDAPTRKGIVAHAIEKASLGRKFDKIFVIGDSPEDIDAAKANNAISVCVPLFRHAKEELLDAGADIVLDDWKDTEWVLEKLT